MREWSVLSSELLIDDRWITVRSDRCRREDGLIIDPYYVLRRPDWICVFAITSDQNVILTREYRHGAGVIGVGFPGGHVEATDVDPKVAAKRELLEETGYGCDDLKCIGSAYANWASHTNLVHYFFGSGAEKIGLPQLDPAEQIEVVLSPLSGFLSGNCLRQSYHLACLPAACAAVPRRDHIGCAQGLGPFCAGDVSAGAIGPLRIRAVSLKSNISSRVFDGKHDAA